MGPDEQARESLEETVARLAVRNRVGERLLHIFSEPEDAAKGIEGILDAALDAVPAEAASFLEVLPEDKRMVFRAARGPVAKEIIGRQLASGTGLAGACIESKRVLAVSDVRKDPRHAAEMHRITGFTTRSLLAAPAIHRGEVLAVIELVNRRHGDVFHRHEIDLLERIGRAAGSYLALTRRWHGGH